MRGSYLRLLCALGALALAEGAGCGGSSLPVGDGGQAGTSGSAGATGGAGHGSGGTSGAAGQGSGGSTGGAGHGGAGGTTGGGGHGGAGGTTGGGGTGGAASCDDLMSQYATALVAANACTVGASGQCAVMASSSLSPCFVNCTTYVQNATTLNDLKTRWMAAGCANKVQVCPAIACLLPTAGTCVAGDGGAGTCVSAAPFN
jgi:hypothetical protein